MKWNEESTTQSSSAPVAPRTRPNHRFKDRPQFFQSWLNHSKIIALLSAGMAKNHGRRCGRYKSSQKQFIADRRRGEWHLSSASYNQINELQEIIAEIIS